MVLTCCARGRIAYLCELVAQLGGQNVCQGHELLCLIGGIAKHVALISSPNLFQCLCSQTMHTLADVWGLLLNVHKYLQAQWVIAMEIGQSISYQSTLNGRYLCCLLATRLYRLLAEKT